MSANDAFPGGPSRLRRTTDGSSRRSGASAVAFWGVALIAGLAAAVMITRYIERRTNASAPPTAKVVVAMMDLPLATTLKAEHLKTVEWPETSQPPGAVHDIKEIIDRVVVAKVVQGEPILASKLAAKGSARGLAALIPASMRAAAVRVDDVVGVAGFIHPEDRVDVIVTIRPPKPADAEVTSKVILQNIKVLAVGKELEVNDKNPKGKAVPVTVATLLVTPDQSERLALAATNGKLLLTLRSWVDNESVETAGIVPSALLADVDVNGPKQKTGSDDDRSRSSTRVARRSDTGTPVASKPEPAKKDVVEILRGDRFEERKFDAKGNQ